jgi:hypothetical protein
MHPLFCPVYVLDRRIQECTSPPKWTKRTTQKVYVGHLHHYSKSVPIVWDPKTKLVSPQFHVMFDDNVDTVQAPDPNIKQSDTVDRLFQTNRYIYYDPFGNEHTYLFTSGGETYKKKHAKHHSRQHRLPKHNNTFWLTAQHDTRPFLACKIS